MLADVGPISFVGAGNRRCNRLPTEVSEDDQKGEAELKEDVISEGEGGMRRKASSELTPKGELGKATKED